MVIGGGIGFWDLWEGGGRTEGGEMKKKMFISVDAGSGHCQPIAMSTTKIAATQPLLFFALHCHRPPSIYVVDRASPYLKLRCSVAKELTISPSGVDKEGTQSVFVDCVVMGGGISGFCIVQVLATKHGNAVPNVIVTEAMDWVGGNIIIVEKDGYPGAERAAVSGRKVARLNCIMVLERIRKRSLPYKIGQDMYHKKMDGHRRLLLNSDSDSML